MRIVFFGTPDFAVPTLEALVTSGHQIPAVVTAPVRRSGRGNQIIDPPVKTAALRLGLPVLQPEKLRDEIFQQTIRSLQADLFVVVAFRMMPESLWSMPALGTINLHASLLPWYRGAAPINRAIMNGETVTGITTFLIGHSIDTGAILLQEKIAIGPDETAGELHDRMMQAGAALVVATVSGLGSGTLQPLPQEQVTPATDLLPKAPKIFPADCTISWNRPARDVHNLVRALHPSPGAVTWFAGWKETPVLVKILRSRITEKETTAPAGTVATRPGSLEIACADQWIEIVEIQQQGRKRMAAAEFVKGFSGDRVTAATHGN